MNPSNYKQSEKPRKCFGLTIMFAAIIESRTGLWGWTGCLDGNFSCDGWTNTRSGPSGLHDVMLLSVSMDPKTAMLEQTNILSAQSCLVMAKQTSGLDPQSAWMKFVRCSLVEPLMVFVIKILISFILSTADTPLQITALSAFFYSILLTWSPLLDTITVAPSGDKE